MRPMCRSPELAAFKMPEAARLTLRQLAQWRPGAHPLFTRGKIELAAERIVAAADWDIEQPAGMLDTLLQGSWKRDEQRRSLVAALALDLPERVAPLGLPASVLDLYPAAILRLAGELIQGGTYNADHYAKDVRFVLGLTVPVGGQICDLSASRALPARLNRLKRAAANALRLAPTGDRAGLAAFLNAHPAAPFVQIHTESRDLSNFSPNGWDEAYLRTAEILETRPQYGGLVGLSWFYDPAIAKVSPRLSYLADRQLENGAIRIPQRLSLLQVELATSRSESRRRLYEAGLYRPQVCAIVWPRQAMLAWARRTRAEAAQRAPAAA
jgi:hypothetical protein